MLWRLDGRAPVCEAGGCRFESCSEHGCFQLGTRPIRTWRNGWRACLISRRLVVRIHPFVLWPWSKKKDAGV